MKFCQQCQPTRISSGSINSSASSCTWVEATSTTNTSWGMKSWSAVLLVLLKWTWGYWWMAVASGCFLDQLKLHATLIFSWNITESVKRGQPIWLFYLSTAGQGSPATKWVQHCLRLPLCLNNSICVTRKLNCPPPYT